MEKESKYKSICQHCVWVNNGRFEMLTTYLPSIGHCDLCKRKVDLSLVKEKERKSVMECLTNYLNYSYMLKYF